MPPMTLSPYLTRFLSYQVSLLSMSYPLRSFDLHMPVMYQPSRSFFSPRIRS